MRRLQLKFAFIAFLLSCVALLLAGCGSSNSGKVVLITLSPSPVSVAYGQSNITLSAVAVNAGNATVSTTYTFSSSNSAAVSISPAGLICGGSWDASFATCTPPANRTPQSATITVTAQNVTQTVQAYVHEKVDSVMISGFRPPQGTFTTAYPGIGASGAACATSANCTCTSLSTVFGVQVSSIASASLPQFQAEAISNDPTVCSSRTPASTAPCNITADLTAGNTSVSPFQWSSSDTTIATIDSTGTATAGTVTPIGTGQASISASASGVNSLAVPFVTCPVNSVAITATSASNNGLGPLSISGTQTLTATATDTANKSVTYSTQNTTNLALTYPGLSWLSTDLYTVGTTSQTATVSTSVPNSSTLTNSTNSAGTIIVNQTVPEPTATANGATDGSALLVTSCTPPTCNKNLFPVYSNPIVTTNAGSNVATAYIASTQSNDMIGLDLGSGVLVVTFSLPSIPNSLLFNRQGTKGIVGSSNGIFIFDPTATTAAAALPFNGTVLAISPDGSTGAVFGNATGVNQNSIALVNLAQDTVTATFPIPGKPTDATQPTVAADFSVDSRYLFVAVTNTAGNRVYVYTTGAGANFFTTTSPALDVAFVAGGPLVYLAGDSSASSITARATCLGGQQNAVTGGTNLANGIIDVQTGTAPTNVRALPNGTGMLALDLPNLDVLTLTNSQVPFAGCPPAQTTNGASVTPLESLSVQSPAGLSSVITAASQLNQFLITQDSSTAVITNTSTSTSGSSVAFVSLSNPQALIVTAVPLANNATLKDATTGLVFKGDAPASSGAFVVGGSDGNLHVISASGGDTAISLSSFTFFQADGVTQALPNLVAIRNQ
jgi:hypothetical protein